MKTKKCKKINKKFTIIDGKREKNGRREKVSMTSSTEGRNKEEKNIKKIPIVKVNVSHITIIKIF